MMCPLDGIHTRQLVLLGIPFDKFKLAGVNAIADMCL